MEQNELEDLKIRLKMIKEKVDDIQILCVVIIGLILFLVIPATIR